MLYLEPFYMWFFIVMFILLVVAIVCLSVMWVYKRDQLYGLEMTVNSVKSELSEKRKIIVQQKQEINDEKEANLDCIAELNKQDEVIERQGKQLSELTEKQTVNNQKGKEGEEAFQKWLDKLNIPNIYLDQNISTYSGFKRPDFILKLNNQLVVVDVKNYKLYPKGSNNLDYEHYGIADEEINLSKEFDGFLDAAIYFVFVTESTSFWRWISLQECIDKNFYKKSKFGKDFNYVHTEHLRTISTKTDLIDYLNNK